MYVNEPLASYAISFRVQCTFTVLFLTVCWKVDELCVEWGSTNTSWHIDVYHVKNYTPSGKKKKKRIV